MSFPIFTYVYRRYGHPPVCPEFMDTVYILYTLYICIMRKFCKDKVLNIVKVQPRGSYDYTCFHKVSHCVSQSGTVPQVVTPCSTSSDAVFHICL